MPRARAADLRPRHRRRASYFARPRRRRDPAAAAVLRHRVLRRATTGVQVGLVPWHEEAQHRLPVAVWRAAMDEHFPDAGWVRLRRDTLDRARRLPLGSTPPDLGRRAGAAAEGGRAMSDP